MKLWDSFLKDVRPWAPGTPAPVAEHAVRRAAQEFCQQTRAWRVQLDPIQTFEGATEYDIPLDQDVELVRIESATLGGTDFAVWRDEPQAPGRFVFTSDGRTLRFSDTPAGGVDLVLTCTVRPGERAVGIDDYIFARHCAVIARGAIALLLNDQVRKAAFDQECAQIRVDHWRGLGRATPRVRPHFF